MPSTLRTLSARRPRIRWGKVLDALDHYYEVGSWREPVLRDRGASPFLVMVSTMLSHRTRDEVTLRATKRLLAEYPSPEKLAKVSTTQIMAIIRGVGLSELKARGLRDAARWLVENHSGRIPESEEELLRIPRVGPKTAHAIMVFGFRQPGLPIDTHILRVAQRLGVVDGTTISQAQDELMRVVPRRYWGLLNPTLVRHGMNICTARAPQCGKCPIHHWCARVGVGLHLGSHRTVNSERRSP
ncbi:MAG: endonuclease III [Nitrososphaerota archaeon]|nr:endonuclease III [Nitrososphaerota archaeon]